MDERSHPDGDAWWFDFTVGSLRCLVQLVAPATGSWSFWACVVEGDDLVAVIDDEVPRSRSLEIRTEGLWAEIVVEEPLDHVSLGCEAFGLRLDPPLDPAAELLGHRVPFGLDLGFETDGEVATEAQGYEMPCRVDGLVLVGAEEIRADGAAGHRGHRWGHSGAAGWLTTARLPEALRN